MNNRATNPSIQIYRNNSEEYYTDERCHILEISNHPGDTELSLAQARVEPAITTAWHAVKNTIECYVILHGTGRVEVGVEQADVSRGDVVLIPAGVRQRITNTGNEDLIFHCLCTPAFRWENYQSLEADAD